MTKEEKRLIQEQTQSNRDLIQEFQKFYRVASKILPEIENTETLRRIKNEREAFRNRNLRE